MGDAAALLLLPAARRATRPARARAVTLADCGLKADAGRRGPRTAGAAAAVALAAAPTLAAAPASSVGCACWACIALLGRVPAGRTEAVGGRALPGRCRSSCCCCASAEPPAVTGRLGCAARGSRLAELGDVGPDAAADTAPAPAPAAAAPCAARLKDMRRSAAAAEDDCGRLSSTGPSTDPTGTGTGGAAAAGALAASAAPAAAAAAARSAAAAAPAAASAAATRAMVAPSGSGMSWILKRWLQSEAEGGSEDRPHTKRRNSAFSLGDSERSTRQNTRMCSSSPVRPSSYSALASSTSMLMSGEPDRATDSSWPVSRGSTAAGTTEVTPRRTNSATAAVSERRE